MFTIGVDEIVCVDAKVFDNEALASYKINIHEDCGTDHHINRLGKK